MTNPIKVLTLNETHIGRILIINGDFRFADEVFGGAAQPVAVAGSDAVTAAPAAATAQPGQSPARQVKDFEIREGEKNLDAITRWVKFFVIVESDGSVSMGDIRDATPPSIIGLYSGEGSARSAVTNSVKSLVDAGVLSAPDGFKKHSLIVEPVREVETETQTQEPTEPAQEPTDPAQEPTEQAQEPATAPSETVAPTESADAGQNVAASDADTINQDDAAAMENLDDGLMDDSVGDGFSDALEGAN